jgi:hypothetical protein
MTMETRTRLPEFLRPLFWDVAFHTLSPETAPEFYLPAGLSSMATWTRCAG